MTGAGGGGRGIRRVISYADLAEAFEGANVHEVFRDGKCSSCHNPHATKHAGLLNDEQGALCLGCHESIAAKAATSHVHPPVGTGDCVVCHADQGQGNIGPNLTDKYWIHGAQPVDNHRVVTEGVLDKGMAAWGRQLGPRRTHLSL